MNYERDYSHTHCYDNQKGHSKHLGCCICRKPNSMTTNDKVAGCPDCDQNENCAKHFVTPQREVKDWIGGSPILEPQEVKTHDCHWKPPHQEKDCPEMDFVIGAGKPQEVKKCPIAVCSHNTNGRDLDKPCFVEFKPPTPSGDEAVEQMVAKLLKEEMSHLLKTIFSLEYSGGEHSKAIHKDIDSLVAGLRAALRSYGEVVKKESRWGHMSAYDDGHSEGKAEGREAALRELEERMPKIEDRKDWYYMSSDTWKKEILAIIEEMRKG